MAATFVKFQKFVLNIGKKVFNLHTDVLKLALTNTLPVVATDNQLSDITQITAANGYSSGGAAVPNNAYTQSGGTGTLVGDAVVFTASGGSIGPFRYVVLYSDTAGNKELIGYFDYGSSITVTNGSTFTVKPGSAATGGTILTVA